jgi:hypothetical protein
MLSVTYTATVYINTRKWTPEWMIKRHELGHVSDDLQALRFEMKHRAGPYPTEPKCQAAAKELLAAFKVRSTIKSLQRDMLAKRFCF